MHAEAIKSEGRQDAVEAENCETDKQDLLTSRAEQSNVQKGQNAHVPACQCLDNANPGMPQTRPDLGPTNGSRPFVQQFLADRQGSESADDENLTVQAVHHHTFRDSWGALGDAA